MAKKKQEIEEAVLVEEPKAILVTKFDSPQLPSLIDTESSIKTIKESLKTYENIVIADTKDKANYDLVSRGMAKFKTDRIAWNKSVNENISEPVKQWLAQHKLDISLIDDEFKSAEATLRAKKQAIDDAKAKEKEEAEAEKLKLMTSRIETIVNLGGKSNGTKYVFDYDLTLFVTLSNMKDLDEKKWKPVLQEIQDAYDLEQKRIADEQQASDDLASANSIKEKELKDKQFKLRLKELRVEGFLSFGNDLVFKHENGSSITIDAVNSYSDEEWDRFIEGVQFYEKMTDSTIDSFFDEPDVDAQPAISFEPTSSATVSAIDYSSADNEEGLPFEEVITEVDESPTVRNNSVEVVLEFSPMEPYIESPYGEGFIQRLYIDSFADYALELTETQAIALQGEMGDILKFVLIAVQK